MKLKAMKHAVQTSHCVTKYCSSYTSTSCVHQIRNVLFSEALSTCKSLGQSWRYTVSLATHTKFYTYIYVCIFKLFSFYSTEEVHWFV